MKIDAVQTIKNTITFNDVLTKYGYALNKARFICCPFHKEKTPSLKIYLKDNSFHCFGCGASGDVIKFVQKLFGLTFPETLKKIDMDFGMNIYGEHSFEDLRSLYRKQQSLNAKQERERRKSGLAELEYWKAFDEWKRLDDNKRKYAPKKRGEEWDELYIEALQKLPYQEFLLDMAEERRQKRE